MATHDAWALVCRLFAGGTPVLRATLSPREVSALSVLGKAVRPTVVDQSFVLCPHCQQHRAQVWSDGRGGRICRCPECGQVPGRARLVDRPSAQEWNGWRWKNDSRSMAAGSRSSLRHRLQRQQWPIRPHL